MIFAHNIDFPLKRSFYQLVTFGETLDVCPYNLLKQGKSLVILGEPGMGKTHTLREIWKISEDYVWVPPASLICNPERFASKGSNRCLVIDGIDELASLQDTDVLNSILNALGKINYPKFVLSCRPAEWKQVTSSLEIQEDDDEGPEVLSLQGLSKEQATEYLSKLGSDCDANAILEHLDQVNLPEFYRNPLYLNLVCEILSRGEPVDFTNKYDAYNHICQVLLSDYCKTHIEFSGQEKLSRDWAFNAAGAICASLLITGRPFINTNQPNVERDNSLALDISEVEGLPNANEVRVILGSPLFQVAENEPECLSPFHRSIAEFLAAHWITNTLEDQHFTRDRFMQSIMVEAEIPSSLRGMCAWLALNEEFTDRVIETDPYGLLIYSDVEQLPSCKIRKLINELVVLDHKHTSFQSENWKEIVPRLVQADTASTVAEIISDESVGSQRKLLFIEAIKVSDQTNVFEIGLRKILYRRSASYTERLHVLEILLEITQDVHYWIKVIKRLRKHRYLDSTEFCIFILDEIGAKIFPVSLVVECILADTGFIRDRNRSGLLQSSSILRLAGHFFIDDYSELLDLISSGIEVFLESEQNNSRYSPSWGSISSFCYPLVERLYKAGSLEFGKFLYWNTTIAKYGISDSSWRSGVDFLLASDTEFRRGLQSYYIDHPENLSFLELFLFRFDEISISLRLSFDDICFHVTQISKRLGSKENDKLVLTALLNFRSYTTDEIDYFSRICKPLIEKDKDLQKTIVEIRTKSQEKPNHSRNLYQRDSIDKNLVALEKLKSRREKIQKNLDDFENGYSKELEKCAKDYLGVNHYGINDRNPRKRVSDEVGEELLNSALKGFRATMNRNDLPTSKDFAESNSRTMAEFQYYSLFAGLAEHLEEFGTFSGVRDEVLLTAFYTLRKYQWIDYQLRVKLSSSIEQEVFPKYGESEVYRLWFEPRIIDGSFDYTEFLSLTNNMQNPSVVVPMVQDWLCTYDTIFEKQAKKLISNLLYPERIYSLVNKDRLVEAALHRLNSKDSGNAKYWASLVFYLDIETFIDKVDVHIQSDIELIWCIRDISRTEVLSDNDYYEKLNLELSGNQLYWIIRNYREKWKHIEYWPGRMDGDMNPWDASEYLQFCIRRLATKVDEHSHDLLDALISETNDGYSECLCEAQSLQNRARIQHCLPSISIGSLNQLLTDNSPYSPKDLQAVILATLDELQRQIYENQEDYAKPFYTSRGGPRSETECRKLLIKMIRKPYGIKFLKERTTPSGVLPSMSVNFNDYKVFIEIKPQWNRNLWDDVNSFPANNFTAGYKTQNFGVYLVLWFGRSTCKGRYLKHPLSISDLPVLKNGPSTPNELNFLLTEHITEGKRDNLRVYVLDLEIKK